MAFYGIIYMRNTLVIFIMGIYTERKFAVNKWIIRARWFYVLGILLIGFLTKISSQSNVDFSRVKMIVLAVTVFGVNFIFYLIIKYTEKDKSDLVANTIGYSQIIFELSILTVVMHYGGGVDGMGIVYFFISIISAALLFGTIGAIYIAILSGSLVNGLVFLEYYGVIDHINRYGEATLEFNNLSNLKVLVSFPLTGKGSDSVTNILFVKTGMAFSSPSVKLPDFAVIL